MRGGESEMERERELELEREEDSAVIDIYFMSERTQRD